MYTFFLYNEHSRVRLVVVEVKNMSDKKGFKHNNKLKELRKDEGLSQQALAQQIGVHYRTLQNWENGNSHIKPEKAEQIAAYFGVSVSYLLGDSINRYELEHIEKAIRDKAIELDNPLDSEALKQTLSYSEVVAFWSLDLKVIQQIYIYYCENKSQLLILKEVLENISKNIENEIKDNMETLSLVESYQAQEVLDEITSLSEIQNKLEYYLKSITDWEKKVADISLFNRMYREHIDFASTNDIAKQIDSIIHNEGLGEFLYNLNKVFVQIESKEEYSDEEKEALDRLDHEILAFIDMLFEKRFLIQKLKRD